MDKLEKALKRFDIAAEYWNPIYERGQEDNDFAYGNQWDSKIRDERETERRPCLTENRLLPYIHQVVNDIRQIRPKIRPVPVDNGADVDTAEVIQGIIRNIEKQSDAESAYDTSAKNAVESSIGWLRVNTRYVDDNSFDQELYIDRIVNPFAVLIDPNHKRLDGADMEWCFILDDMDKEDFEEAYPDANGEFDAEVAVKGWCSDNTVRICEYYYKDYEYKTLVKANDGQIYYKDELPEELESLQEREVEIPKIRYCKITANDILEEQEILGRFIPIVPVVGEEVFRNGKREFYSLIHQAKDPQFMLNVWKSASTEIIGLQPKAPYIGAKGSFDTYAKQWANANVKNYPFLQYDVVETASGQIAPPPQKQMPVTGSSSMMQEAMASAEAIKAVLGMYDASAGEQTDDVSGKAIIARQVKGDNATFHFVDNLVTAMKQVGRILVDLIPLYYDNKRIIKIIGEDGQEKLMPINQPIMKDPNGRGFVPLMVGGEQVKPFMMMEGKYDIDIDVGANYATKRQEEANAIIELAKVNPEILSIAGDLFVKALDIPNGQEIAKRIQSQMNPALLGDDPQAAMMKAQNDAIKQLEVKLSETEAALQLKQNNEQFKNQLELQKLQLEKEKLQLEASKAMADINNDKMEIELKRVETEAEALKDKAQAFDAMSEQVADITEAMDVILSGIETERMATGEPNTPEPKEE